MNTSILFLFDHFTTEIPLDENGLRKFEEYAVGTYSGTNLSGNFIVFAGDKDDDFSVCISSMTLDGEEQDPDELVQPDYLPDTHPVSWVREALTVAFVEQRKDSDQ